MGETKIVSENMSLENALAEHGSIIWHGKGISMRPLIRDSVDYVVIEKPSREIKPYDVVLYARDVYEKGDTAPTRKYVLHRVLKKDGDTYIILGDNCVNYEYVPADKIVGIMTGLVRKRKPYDFDSKGYKAYMNLWVKPYKIRKELTRARFIAKAAGRKLIKGIKRIGK